MHVNTENIKSMGNTIEVNRQLLILCYFFVERGRELFNDNYANYTNLIRIYFLCRNVTIQFDKSLGRRFFTPLPHTRKRGTIRLKTGFSRGPETHWRA